MQVRGQATNLPRIPKPTKSSVINSRKIAADDLPKGKEHRARFLTALAPTVAQLIDDEYLVSVQNVDFKKLDFFEALQSLYASFEIAGEAALRELDNEKLLGFYKAFNEYSKLLGLKPYAYKRYLNLENAHNLTENQRADLVNGINHFFDSLSAAKIQTGNDNGLNIFAKKHDVDDTLYARAGAYNYEFQTPLHEEEPEEVDLDKDPTMSVNDLNSMLGMTLLEKPDYSKPQESPQEIIARAVKRMSSGIRTEEQSRSQVQVWFAKLQTIVNTHPFQEEVDSLLSPEFADAFKEAVASDISQDLVVIDQAISDIPNFYKDLDDFEQEQFDFMKQVHDLLIEGFREGILVDGQDHTIFKKVEKLFITIVFAEQLANDWFGAMREDGFYDEDLGPYEPDENEARMKDDLSIDDPEADYDL